MHEVSLVKRFTNRFLEIFFYYLYHQMSWAYDWVASIVSLGSWKSWGETSLNYLQGQKILELGHGPGHLNVKLAHAGKLVFGIDASQQMVTIASGRLRRYNLPVNLCMAVAQALPFCTEEFDHIVATFPTEYIFDVSTLREIYRVLKAGGSAVIIPVAYIKGTTILEKAAAWLFKISGQAPQLDHRIADPLFRVGFEVTINQVILKSSEVITIVARKP